MLLGCFFREKQGHYGSQCLGSRGRGRQAWEEVKEKDPVGAPDQGISWQEPSGC